MVPDRDSGESRALQLEITAAAKMTQNKGLALMCNKVFLWEMKDMMMRIIRQALYILRKRATQNKHTHKNVCSTSLDSDWAEGAD